MMGISYIVLSFGFRDGVAFVDEVQIIAILLLIYNVKFSKM